MIKLLFLISNLCCSPTKQEIYQRCLEIEEENRKLDLIDEDESLLEWIKEENCWSFESFIDDLKQGNK